MAADNKKLQQLARTDPDGFETYYRQNVDRNASGATIAAKQSYWRSVDLSTLSTSSSSSTSSTSSGASTAGDMALAAETGGVGLAIKKTFGFLDNAIKGTANIAEQFYDTQIGQADAQGSDKVKKLFDIVQNGGLNPVKLLSEGMAAVGEELISQLKTESELRSEINSKSMLTGQLSEDLRKDMVESSIGAARYGMSLADIGDLYVGLTENSGKFSLINKGLIDTVVPVAKSLSMSMKEFANTISTFETVGAGADLTVNKISTAITDSVALGLNARKITESMQQNIGKLNEYGFKKGIDGLKEMTQKSAEFRMSMDSVFSVAEKVFSPEKALDLSANLQVLGGAIGDFNDPLKLMYMATNNVEGLQDALIGAAGSLSTYNQEQGRFEVTGANLRKSKEMADQFGISMGELNKIAIAAAERTQASTALMSSGLVMKDDDREFLTNLSRMEGGEMKITVPESLAKKLGLSDTKIALDELKPEMMKALLSNREAFKEMSPKDMAMAQLTETQQMARDMGVVAAYYRVRGAQIIKGAAKGMGGPEFENLRKTISDYAKETVNKPSDYGLEKRSENRAKEVRANPIESIKQFGRDAVDYIKGEKTTASVETKSKVTHEFVFGRSDALMDSFNREIVRDTSIATNWTTGNKNEYTSPV
jgi:hypothetical protein